MEPKCPETLHLLPMDSRAIPGAALVVWESDIICLWYLLLFTADPTGNRRTRHLSLSLSQCPVVCLWGSHPQDLLAQAAVMAGAKLGTPLELGLPVRVTVCTLCLEGCLHIAEVVNIHIC